MGTGIGDEGVPLIGGPFDGLRAGAMAGNWRYIDRRARRYARAAPGRALYVGAPTGWFYAGAGYVCGCGCFVASDERGRRVPCPFGCEREPG